MKDKEGTNREEFITIDNMRKLMIRAFRVGQDSGNDYPARLWVEEEIYKYQNKKLWK